MWIESEFDVDGGSGKATASLLFHRRNSVTHWLRARVDLNASSCIAATTTSRPWSTPLHGHHVKRTSRTNEGTRTWQGLPFWTKRYARPSPASVL
jgi:hypothetical protein